MLSGVLIKNSNRIYPNLYKNIDPWPGIYSANKINKKKENTILYNVPNTLTYFLFGKDTKHSFTKNTNNCLGETH